MRAILVGPPTLTRDELADPAAVDLGQHLPLGLLAVAAVAEATGHRVEVVDTNDLLIEHGPGRDLARAVSERIDASGAGLVGFGSISASYPITIAMARETKRRRTDLTCVLGGPQASAVASETLEAFSEVDYVLRGEADTSFPFFLDRLENGADPTDTDGLTFRRDGKIVERPVGPLPDLATLPLPLYRLSPHIDADTTLALELGRGCPYACTFCSTNDFFRRQFRLKPAEQVLAEMRRLAGQYGVGSFELVHDMFTVDRRKVIELCDVLKASGDAFTWSVSARTDRVDDELLERMSEAGCRGIFYGIETGSQRLQKIVRKRLDLGKARQALRATSDLGINAIASLIVGFPDETEVDFRQTVDFFVDALRSPRVTPQLHLLAPLPGTPIARNNPLRPDDRRSDISSDLGSDDERAVIERYPDVFSSFLAVPTGLPRSILDGVREFLVEFAVELRWLLVALHHEWHAYDLARRFWASYGKTTAPTRALLRTFVREQLLPESRAPASLESLLRLYADEPNPDEPSGGRQPASGPRVASDARFVRLRVNYGELLSTLESGGDLAALETMETAYLMRTSRGRHEVVALDPILARVLANGEPNDLPGSANAAPEVRAALQYLRDEALIA